MSAFPYRIHVRWSEADDAYVGEVPAFPGAGGDGPTMEEAVARAQESVRELLAAAQEFGDPIPASDVEDLQYSGQIRLRMPKSMHCALATAAQREGVSLNQYMVTLLSAQMERQPLARFTATSAAASPPTQVLTAESSMALQALSIVRSALRPAYVVHVEGGSWGSAYGILKEPLQTAVTSNKPMALKA